MKILNVGGQVPRREKRQSHHIVIDSSQSGRPNPQCAGGDGHGGACIEYDWTRR